jgi:quercetin dioxygenase-like cupin family protein
MPRAGDTLTFDVAEHIRAARASSALAAPTSHTAVTLVKRPDLRVVLLVLTAGARVATHRAGGSVSIHALDGRARVRVGGDSLELDAGRLVVLGANVEHDVDAIEASALLVTMAWHTAP